MIAWTYPDTSTAIARFTANAVSVTLTLDQHENSWLVKFEVDGEPNDVAYSALEIYRGVFDAILEFLAVREPQTMLFTTGREDLAGVYRKYLKKRAPKFAELGYRLDGERRVLRRFKPSRWASTVEA